jgi:ferredoxin
MVSMIGEKKIAGQKSWELDAVLSSVRDNHTHREEDPPKLKRPTIPRVTPAADAERESFLKKLRVFYRDGCGDDMPVAAHGRPALLSRYGDWRRVRYDYPIWISSDGTRIERLTDLLSSSVGRAAPAADAARILKDNVLRLELIIRESLKEIEEKWDRVLTAALDELERRLHLKGDDAKAFSADRRRLVEELPKDGSLISYGDRMVPVLLDVSLRKQRAIRSEFLINAGRLKERLQEMLRVDEQKRPTAHAPEKLKDSYGYGGSFIDFKRFSSVMPDAASEILPADRRRRIEDVIGILNDLDEAFKPDALIVSTPSTVSLVSDRLESCSLQSAGDPSVCVSVEKVFDAHMVHMARVMKAIRMAELELAGHYDADVHDRYFETFDWRALTDEEIAVCPPAILLVRSDELMGEELARYSRLLVSIKPIKTFVLQRGFHPEGRSKPEGNFEYRQELGALAVSHRHTYVLQATPLHPASLVEDIRIGLNGAVPALFYFLTPEADLSYVRAGAAWEGRAFPEFVYDRTRGSQFGSRFDVERNPQVESDWPVYELEYDDNGKTALMNVAFTFADFAALEPEFSRHFLPVPPGCWTDDLVPYADFLKLSPPDAYRKMPFIWMIDAEGWLQKVAVSHLLVWYGQERLDFWRFIQEIGGINNYHVARAIGRVREEFEKAKAEEMSALTRAHDEETQRVRETAAREAMEKLSAILLDLDSIAALPVSRPAQVRTAEVKDETPAPAAVAEPVAVEETVSVEPWIETFRCTSCNECININPNCFKYDGNKQAVIADATAATFAQIVAAAEKCPAKCIHPGAPLNSNEPGLDDLVKRAAAFG